MLKKQWQVVLILSITGITGFNTLLYIALHYTTSINASIVNTSTPILLFLLSFIFLKEKLNTKQVAGALLSLVGLLFIISKGSITILLQLSFNKGDLIVIGAVICWSIYSLLIRRYAGILPTYSTFVVTAFLGILILLPFSIVEMQTKEIVWSLATIATILYTGIFASIVAFMSWNTAVERVGPSKAGVFLNLIPVFAAIFAVLFIDESLAWYQGAGGVLVILGVFISTRITKKEKHIQRASRSVKVISK